MHLGPFVSGLFTLPDAHISDCNALAGTDAYLHLSRLGDSQEPLA